MIYDVIYSLFVLIEKFAFFNKQLQEFVISLLMLGFLKATFLVLKFSYYTLMTCFMILSAILLSMLILSVIWHLICGNKLNWLLNLNLIYETLEWGRKWLVDFNARKAQVSFDWSITQVLLM